MSHHACQKRYPVRFCWLHLVTAAMIATLLSGATRSPAASPDATDVRPKPDSPAAILNEALAAARQVEGAVERLSVLSEIATGTVRRWSSRSVPPNVCRETYIGSHDRLFRRT